MEELVLESIANFCFFLVGLGLMIYFNIRLLRYFRGNISEEEWEKIQKKRGNINNEEWDKIQRKREILK